jgi:enamine deaminase RidA (YjgF/YER057c/UK114 family)
MRILTALAAVVALVVTTAGQSSSKQFIPTRGSSNVPVSPAVKARGVVYVSTTLATNEKGAIVTGDLKAQTAESFARLGRALMAAGFDWSDVVDGIAFLPDLTHIDNMNAAYRERFTKGFPARVTVGAQLMGGNAMVEIMLTAVK